MVLARTLAVFFLFPSLILAADPTKVRTLSGATLEGELVGISDKEVVLRINEMPSATPIAAVLEITLPALPPLDQEGKITDIELVDGTLFHCSMFNLKGKEVEFKTLLGQSIKVPL